jgi:putative aldouronate transport system substrate-binding protein
MRILTVLAATLLSTSLTAPALADGHLKIVDEPVEFTVHLHNKRYFYDENWPVEQAARAMTGVALKGATFGTNTPSSKEAHNLMLASGDIPHIVGGDKIKDMVNEYGPQGAFVPLNDLIDEHAPNIKAFFDKYPDKQSAVQSFDGNLYYIPYLPDGKYGRAYWMRLDWLDALGLEVPNNVDELYEVLTAFRNNDPNGNGEKDEVPFFVRQWQELLRLVTLWDGRSSGSDTAHDFLIADGKVAHGYAGEGYREGIKNIAKWYQEGLIDAEVFTRGSSAREYLLSENLGGMTHDWFASTSGYNPKLRDKIDGFDLAVIAPPASISGVRMAEHRRIPVKPDGWAISHTNPDPVTTIKYFDFYFTEEGRRLANFGIEGEQYDMVDGKAIFKKEFIEAGPVNSQLYQVGSQVQRGYFQDFGYEIQWTNPSAVKGIELYDAGDYLVPQFLGVAFNEAEQGVYDKKWSQVRDYMLEKQQAWILGSADVEAEWDDYLATLDKMGFNDVLDAMNSAYARQYGG